MKRSPIILFSIAFILVIIIMFVANYKSTLQHELDVPVSGIERLYTIGNSLVAVSTSKEVYVWNWNRMSDKPTIKSFGASILLWLAEGKLVWLPHENSDKIVTGNFGDDTKQNRLTFGTDWQCRQLGMSRTGQLVAAAFTDKEKVSRNFGVYNRVRFEMLSDDWDELVPVITIDNKKDVLLPYELAVSDDGAFIASVGQKNKSAWIVAVDVAQKQILWEQTIQESEYFTDVAFSPNGKIVYAGGEGKHLYGFETISGKVVRQLLMEEVSDINKTRSFNKQRVTCAEVSPDGHIVAAGVSPSNIIYFWDTMTGATLGIMEGCYGLNNLAFSPDSTTFVVAGRNYGGSLKVSRVPGG